MRVAVAAGLALLLTCPGTAVAQDEDNVEPFTVRRLELAGVSHVDEGDLRDALVTQEPSWVPFTSRPAYVPSDLKDDIARIHTFYQQRGYREARVTLVDVEVDETDRRVDIAITVDEGEPTRMGTLRWEGFDEVDASRLRTIEDQSPLREDDPLDRVTLAALQAGSVRALRDIGYASASVDVHEVPRSPNGPVDVALVARPGPLTRFGEIEVTGQRTVNERVIRRLITFETGEPFTQADIERTERNLRQMELFSFVYVEPRHARPPEDVVPIRVTVAEGRHRRLDGGVGYGTEEQVRAQANWRHLNLMGRGRTLSLEGKASALDRGARANLAEPYFFSRYLSLSAEAHGWVESEPIFRMRTYGGRGTVTWLRDSRDTAAMTGSSTSLALTAMNDFTRYSVAGFALQDPSYVGQLIGLGLDPVTGAGAGTLVALRLQALHSTVADLARAPRGYSVSVAAERAGGLLTGDFTYTEYTGEARHYQPMRRGLVVANRIRVGLIDDGAATAEEAAGRVPFFKRYFLGGSTSLRGWGRFDVSPLTESGLPIGGLALLETSSEVRVPVSDDLSVVGFVDTGNVWRRPGDLDTSGLRVSVGPGIRYLTPVGPVRLDVGYQLTPIDGLVVRGRPETRPWRVHVSIGQAF